MNQEPQLTPDSEYSAPQSELHVDRDGTSELSQLPELGESNGVETPQSSNQQPALDAKTLGVHEAPRFDVPIREANQPVAPNTPIRRNVKPADLIRHNSDGTLVASELEDRTSPEQLAA